MSRVTGKNSIGGFYPALILPIDGVEDWEEIPETPAELIVTDESNAVAGGRVVDESSFKFFITISRRQATGREETSPCWMLRETLTLR